MSGGTSLMLRLRLNCSVICVCPSVLIELIESKPSMVENCRSNGVATAEAMVSGFAPGQTGRDQDRRKIHVRQVAHGQEAERGNSEDEHAHHDKRCGHRPSDEQFGDVHERQFGGQFKA